MNFVTSVNEHIRHLKLRAKETQGIDRDLINAALTAWEIALSYYEQDLMQVSRRVIVIEDNRSKSVSNLFLIGTFISVAQGISMYKAVEGEEFNAGFALNRAVETARKIRDNWPSNGPAMKPEK